MKKNLNDMTDIEQMNLYLYRARVCFVILIACSAVSVVCGIVTLCV